MKVKSKMISNLPWCVVDLFCSFSPPPAPGPLIVGIQLKHKCPKNEPSICRHYLAYNISSAFQIVENGYNLKHGPNNLKPKHFIYLNGCPSTSIWYVLWVEKQKIKVTAVEHCFIMFFLTMSVASFPAYWFLSNEGFLLTRLILVKIYQRKIWHQVWLLPQSCDGNLQKWQH